MIIVSNRLKSHLMCKWY